MKLFSYRLAGSNEGLIASELAVLAELCEREAAVLPYVRKGRKVIHNALRELQRRLQLSAKELLDAKASILAEPRRRRSLSLAIAARPTWRIAVREGLLLLPKHKAQAVRVTLQGWERGLQIADDLFTMAARRGYQLFPWQEGDKTLRIRAVDAELEFRVMEKLTRVHDDAEGTATGTPHQSYFLTTGVMSIHLTRAGGGLELIDADDLPLESQLEELFDRIPHEFALDIAQNRRWKQQAEAFAAERAAEVEIRRLNQEEEGKRKQLDEEARDWHRATLIRCYVDEVERRQHAGAGSATEVWLRWARAVADDVDPIFKRCELLSKSAT
ncbi:hypothetical protein [Achromobacter kerstersii]